MATLSYGQSYDCKLVVTNMTGSPLVVGAKITDNTPNICPPTTIDEVTIDVAVGATEEMLLGTVSIDEPMIFPYVIGAHFVGGGSGSWTTNACWHWNPSCVASSGPLTFVVTSCGSNITYVTVF